MLIFPRLAGRDLKFTSTVLAEAELNLHYIAVRKVVGTSWQAAAS
jgi:hypothetical protein